VAAIHLGPASPPASCGPPGDSAGPASAAASPRPCVPYSTLLRVGFTEPTGHPAAGALLPHRFTLTALRAGRRSALCGTVLRVAPTGGWPAPCPVEAGLSSTPANRDRGRPAGSPCPASMPPEAGPAGTTDLLQNE